MEMIEELSSTHKTHFEEIKEYVANCLDQINHLTREHDELRRLYEQEKHKRDEIEAERDDMKHQLETNTQSYLREFSEAKHHWEGVEDELRRTTDSIQHELIVFEEHNAVLNDKLILLETEMKNVLQREEEIRDDRDRLKEKEQTLELELKKFKTDFENVSDELHQTKMKILQEENYKGNLLAEVKKYKKAAEAAVQKISIMMEEKSMIIKNAEELTQVVLKNKSIEGEIKDIKFYLNILGKGNGTISSKLDNITNIIKKDNKDISIQTELTTKQLTEYDNLDREATLLVMKMKEEMIYTKDELLATRQENETLKNYVRDVKRDREMKEEEERVEKLEEAVKALGELVTKEQNKPSREDTIIKKLTEVKKDLDFIKSSTKSKKILEDDNQDLAAVPIKLTSFRNSRR